MADTPLPGTGLSNLSGLLGQILGASTDSSNKQNLTTAQQIQALLNNTQNQNQTTTGNNNTDVIGQLISQLTGNTTQNTQQNANVTALQSVQQRQAAGITPDMLKAIFTEGAKAVPQLVATSANAVGARSADNSPLATTLRDLNTNLTSQAAIQSQGMLKDAGTSAAQIADLTKSSATTGTTAQGTSQNNSSTTAQNSTQQLQSLLTQLQTNNTNTNTQQQTNSNGNQTTGINLPQTAGAAGLAALLGAANGGAGSGLLNSVVGGVKNLFGGSGGTDSSGGLFSGGDPLATIGDNSAPFTNPTSGFDTSGTGGYSNGFDGSSGDGVSYFNDPTTPQFADGGVVNPLTIGKSGNQGVSPQVTALLALAGHLAGSMSPKQ